ncbi:hypothetical protein P8452_32117 [Trifolium repens]|nr:hypothetical protein P8452_32117 [Trifolium repens]
MAIELELFSFQLFVIIEILKGNDAELENPALYVANNSVAQGKMSPIIICDYFILECWNILNKHIYFTRSECYCNFLLQFRLWLARI